MKSDRCGLRATWIAAALLCCLYQTGLAREASLPIEITADTAEYDENSQRVTYVGNVRVVQGEATLECAHLTLHQPKQGPQVIVAHGNPVRFHQPGGEDGKEITGTSDRAEYDVDSQLLTLIGNAELIHEGDRVTSDRIVYDISSATAMAGAAASGTERVRTIIQPRQ